jgi:hypothetical protein
MKNYEVLLDLNSVRFCVSASNEYEAVEIARRTALNNGIDLYDALKWAEASVEEVTE